jgi:hypothetical protein
VLFSVMCIICVLSYCMFIQGIRPGPRLLVVFRNKLIFYGEKCGTVQIFGNDDNKSKPDSGGN